MTSERFTLAYVSVADRDMPAAELEDIVVRAAAANIERGLTGILLFNGLNFFQILQGHRDEVEGLFGRIMRDGRHHAVSRLPAQPFEHLRFPAWGMVFWGDDAVSKAAEYRFAAMLGKSVLELTDPAARSILRSFLGMFAEPAPTPRRAAAAH